MRLPFLYEHYLRAHIDFSAFLLLGMFPQNKSDAVILLAPRDPSRDMYFNVQYKGNNAYFTDVEQMTDYCKAHKYISSFQARKICKYYNKLKEAFENGK